MKKYVPLFILLFLGLSWQGFAQRPAVDREKLEAARVAFITTRIDLKPEQAEKFWPLFNEFNDLRESTMRQISQLSKNIDAISEEEAKTRIQKRMQLHSQLLKEEQDFVKKVSTVLSSKQILLLNNVARDFTRHLYQRSRENK